jgi:hypothetical protein
LPFSLLGFYPAIGRASSGAFFDPLFSAGNNPWKPSAPGFSWRL